LQELEQTANNFPIVTSGRFFKTAWIKDEFWLPEPVLNPETILDTLKREKKADIFSFTQKLPDTTPKFPYFYELENVAAIPLTNYENWWKKQINDKTRNRTRKAEKTGVVIRQTEFNDELISGIMGIYNETPFRQGRRFWHYGKSFEMVKKENATFLDHADFIGAYLGTELIGFIKMVYADPSAMIMQIISKICHRDKAPINALVAKAVELSINKKMSYLLYSNFDYGKKGKDSLSEFKAHNGFIQIDLPRYYIPLTLKGTCVLKTGLHRPVTSFIPRRVLLAYLHLRSKWYARIEQRMQDKKL
jgi:hypothetical protein